MHSRNAQVVPVAVAYMRRLKTSLRIDYEGKDVDVPPGTSIIIVPWVIHRNEEYFPNPEQFDPDRFLPEELQETQSLFFGILSWPQELHWDQIWNE
ncbi:Cytochrome P450 6B1 [Orchesella cincta]|uniref:Cytochrome P450 6B1 n=1 Tax=Orchesella cincta TaxID=48709 RepID=A0A1D2M3A1_ORCCI|nr:Cytochrome P450 6B1 [Orchesella cincta]